MVLQKKNEDWSIIQRYACACAYVSVHVMEKKRCTVIMTTPVYMSFMHSETKKYHLQRTQRIHNVWTRRKKNFFFDLNFQTNSTFDLTYTPQMMMIIIIIIGC